MDLNIPRADRGRASSASSDLQHSGRADGDVQVQLVCASAAIMVVNRTRDKRNRDCLCRIAADAADDAITVEVDDAHVDPRRSGWVA